MKKQSIEQLMSDYSSFSEELHEIELPVWDSLHTHKKETILEEIKELKQRIKDKEDLINKHPSEYCLKAGLRSLLNRENELLEELKNVDGRGHPSFSEGELEAINSLICFHKLGFPKIELSREMHLEKVREKIVNYNRLNLHELLKK
jgi:hypothetical protein